MHNAPIFKSLYLFHLSVSLPTVKVKIIAVTEVRVPIIPIFSTLNNFKYINIESITPASSIKLSTISGIKNLLFFLQISFVEARVNEKLVLSDCSGKRGRKAIKTKTREIINNIWKLNRSMI